VVHSIQGMKQRHTPPFIIPPPNFRRTPFARPQWRDSCADQATSFFLLLFLYSRKTLTNDVRPYWQCGTTKTSHLEGFRACRPFGRQVRLCVSLSIFLRSAPSTCQLQLRLSEGVVTMRDAGHTLRRLHKVHKNTSTATRGGGIPPGPCLTPGILHAFEHPSLLHHHNQKV